MVRPVQHRDPLGPRIGPVAERPGVSGPGPQEIPPDVSPAPQRVDAVDAGQPLAGLAEAGRDDQAAARLQRGLLPVDAQLAGGDLGAAGSSRGVLHMIITPASPAAYPGAV